MTPQELEGRYASIWSSIEQKSPHEIELVHPGIPDENKIVLWHAYPRGADKVPHISVNVASVDDEQELKKRVQIFRFDTQGRYLNDTQLPPATPTMIERIEVRGLIPGASYDVSVNNKSVKVATKPSATTAQSTSFLAFSCNNPFSSKNAKYFSGFESVKLNSLALMRSRATGEIQLAGFPNQPSFGIGLGDQVYVDGDNEKPEASRAKPLALFQGSSSLSRFDAANSNQLLEIIYRYHFAMPTFDGMLTAIPTAMAWDDHELRDGWGSREDDASAPMQRYYYAARQAFINYQTTRNPEPWIGASTPALDVRFDWGSQIKVMMMDGRTHRKYGQRDKPASMFSEAQWKSLEAWLSVDPKKPMVFVLGLTSPLASTPKPIFNLVDVCTKGNDSLVGEGADDIRDTWMCHPDDQKRLIDMLVSHFTAATRHRLLILSGDVHYSSVVYLKAPNDKIIGHEVISSGITNEHVKASIEKKGFFDAGLLQGSSDNSWLFGIATGALFGTPSFAEIVVTPAEGNEAPSASVVFFPSHSRVNDKVVNPVARLKGKLNVDLYDPEKEGCTSHAPSTTVRSDLLMKVPDVMKKRGYFCLQAESQVCLTDVDVHAPAKTWDGLAPNVACQP